MKFSDISNKLNTMLQGKKSVEAKSKKFAKLPAKFLKYVGGGRLEGDSWGKATWDKSF